MSPGGADSAEGFGFGRQRRLLKPAEYATVFSERRMLRGACFALHYRANGLPFSRLGLVIPKKQARTAVLRNAIKRQARELFRLRSRELPMLDIVLRLAQAPVPDRARWREDIAALFERLGRPRQTGEVS